MDQFQASFDGAWSVGVALLAKRSKAVRFIRFYVGTESRGLVAGDVRNVLRGYEVLRFGFKSAIIECGIKKTGANERVGRIRAKTSSIEALNVELLKNIADSVLGAVNSCGIDKLLRKNFEKFQQLN